MRGAATTMIVGLMLWGVAMGFVAGVVCVQKNGGFGPCADWFRNAGIAFTTELKVSLLATALMPILAALLQPMDDAKGLAAQSAIFIGAFLIWMLVLFGLTALLEVSEAI